jgi:hypothetical protein
MCDGLQIVEMIGWRGTTDAPSRAIPGCLYGRTAERPAKFYQTLWKQSNTKQWRCWWWLEPAGVIRCRDEWAFVLHTRDTRVVGDAAV